MSEEPVTKVGAKLALKINLGDFNNAELTIWFEDRVRPEDGSASKAVDRITRLLDFKLKEWSKGFQA